MVWYLNFVFDSFWDPGGQKKIVFGTQVDKKIDLRYSKVKDNG